MNMNESCHNFALPAGYVISDSSFDASLRDDPDIALAAVSYDGCALKHVSAQLRHLVFSRYSRGVWHKEESVV